MDKQQFANRYSLDEWRKLCKRQDFAEAFWLDCFEECERIAKEILYK